MARGGAISPVPVRRELPGPLDVLARVSRTVSAMYGPVGTARWDARGLAALMVLALLSACAPAGTGRELPERTAPAAALDGEAGPGATVQGGGIFTDRAPEAGIDFVHVNGASGRFYIPEILAPGVALFDFDNDADLDVFVGQGRPLDGLDAEAAAPTTGVPTQGRLYRNDTLADGPRRTIRFTDVSARSGLETGGYPMGAATGDFDNDGCVDLFVTELGVSQLFRSRCDGTFTDVTRAAGLDTPGWATSASFVDYDRDGRLDLFVGHYVRQPLDGQSTCRASSGQPDYCSPQAFRAQPDRLYHNDGNGRFSDVSRRALVGGHFGPALGVSTADFDNDGWIDIFVANDGEASQLWMNLRNGTFKDTASMAGVAVGSQGTPEGNMGVDAGDFDDDGDEDLFDTVLPGQGSNLWANDGSGLFEDQSARSGLAAVGLGFTGFGAAWFDYDNDGRLDLLTVNGAVSLKASRRPEAPYAESKLLFHNAGRGRFEDVTRQAGEVFALHEVSRGAAFGDIDNDGDTDVLVGNNNGPLRLLVNNVGSRQRWLGLSVLDDHGRPALGARVAVAGIDGRTIWRRARSDGSYASANDPRVLAGLGRSTDPPDVRVVWPDGRVEEWARVPIDRYVTVQQGTGTPGSATGAPRPGRDVPKQGTGT